MSTDQPDAEAGGRNPFVADAEARSKLREATVVTHHGAEGKLLSLEADGVSVVAQIEDGAHECALVETLCAIGQAARDQPTLLQQGNRYQRGDKR